MPLEFDILLRTYSKGELIFRRKSSTAAAAKKRELQKERMNVVIFS